MLFLSGIAKEISMFDVLVAEDDFAVRKLTTVVLKNAGFSSRAYETAEEAFAAAKEKRPSVAVVDVMLPGENGYRLTADLRKLYPDLPIIIVTAKSMPSDKRYGFIVGADDYLVKPVDEEELILRIRALLRRSGAASEQKLTAGDVTADYASMTATVKGRDAGLTQKEFLLLFKLISGAGKIFTRDELVAEVWGERLDDDHTLNVHINRLREKLADSATFDIKSIRGLGYKAVIKSDEK